MTTTIERPPTQRQILALEALADERSEDVAPADLRRLASRGWATDHTSLWELTPDGETALQAARDRRLFDEVAGRFRIRVRRRRLGGSPIRGINATSWGREVYCGEGCSRPSHGVVWFVNEAGREADKRAERALIRHVLAHARGEIA